MRDGTCTNLADDQATAWTGVDLTSQGGVTDALQGP